MANRIPPSNIVTQYILMRQGRQNDCPADAELQSPSSNHSDDDGECLQGECVQSSCSSRTTALQTSSRETVSEADRVGQDSDLAARLVKLFKQHGSMPFEQAVELCNEKPSSISCCLIRHPDLFKAALRVTAHSRIVLWTVKDGGQSSATSLTPMHATQLNQPKAPSSSTDDSPVATQPLATPSRPVNVCKPTATASSSCSDDRAVEWLPRGSAVRASVKASLADHYVRLLGQHGPMTSQELFALSTEITHSARSVTTYLSRRPELFGSERLMDTPGRPAHTWFLKSAHQVGASSPAKAHSTPLNHPQIPALSTNESLVSSTPLAQASRSVKVIKPTDAASSSGSESDEGEWQPSSRSQARSSSHSSARQATRPRAPEYRYSDRLGQMVRLIQQHGPMTSRDLLTHLKEEAPRTDAITHFLTAHADIFRSERPIGLVSERCSHVWHLKHDGKAGASYLTGTQSTLPNLPGATTSSTYAVSSTTSEPSNPLSDDNAANSTPHTQPMPKRTTIYQQGAFGGRATHLMPRVWENQPQLSLGESARTISTRRTEVTILPASGHIGGKRPRDDSALSDVQAPPRKRHSEGPSVPSMGQTTYNYLDELGQWQPTTLTPAAQNSSTAALPEVEPTLAAPESEWVCSQPDSLFPELNLS